MHIYIYIGHPTPEHSWMAFAEFFVICTYKIYIYMILYINIYYIIFIRTYVLNM